MLVGYIAGQKRTVHTYRLLTVTSIVTDAQVRPFVVKGPHNLFPVLYHLLQAGKRNHSLVNPMQMNDVGLFVFFGLCDINTKVGCVCLP